MKIWMYIAAPFVIKKLFKRLQQSEFQRLNLESQLAQIRQEAENYRRQTIGLKNWIKTVHRLDTVPESNTIRDLLQTPR